MFVTGGSGFVGRHLLPLLVAGHEILCLSRAAPASGDAPTLRTIRGDLKDPSSYGGELERFRPECCIHLAWEGLPDYSAENCRANLLLGMDLLRMLGRLGCRKVVAAGSCWEYGDCIGSLAEDRHGHRLGLFAAHKVALQTIGQSILEEYNGRLVWARIFFAYGPGQRASALIPSCHDALRQGLAPSIRTPSAAHDFVYVSDVAASLRLLLETDVAAGVYNIGSGHATPVGELANLVAARMGRPPVYAGTPEPGFAAWANAGKMAALGWRAEVSLPAGLERTIQALGSQT